MHLQIRSHRTHREIHHDEISQSGASSQNRNRSRWSGKCDAARRLFHGTRIASEVKGNDPRFRDRLSYVRSAFASVGIHALVDAYRPLSHLKGKSNAWNFERHAFDSVHRNFDSNNLQNLDVVRD
jgi:hypothetical protein